MRKRWNKEDIDFLINYIQSFWEPWMNWDNYGKYKINGPKTWNIDHIIPLKSFDMENPIEQQRGFHWSNCKPMLSSDNNKKGSKVDWGIN